MMNPSHLTNNSLFLGDLSKFCTEAELESLFSCCGQILDVKIKRNNNTGKTLSYGFVTFVNEEVASHAMKRMDGTMFYGRKLRIRWAQYNARSQNPINEQVINSVYVRFVTPKLDIFITEEDLHNVFDRFGNVVDASIKESSIDKRTNRQSGYGFVHFSCDKAGVECAFQAVSALDNATVNGVTYYVELSKNLLKQFNELNNHNPNSMMDPHHRRQGSGSNNTSPTYANNQQQRGVGVTPAPFGMPNRPHFGPESGHFMPPAAPQQQPMHGGHFNAQPQHQFLPPHEYYPEDRLGNGVPQGYSPKSTPLHAPAPVHHHHQQAAGGRSMQPHHFRGDSGVFGSGELSFGPLSVHSFSGSASPLPHAVSPSNHGTLTPPPGGRWSGPNNTSMHSMNSMGVSPPREDFMGPSLSQHQQMIRPNMPRLHINTAAANNNNNPDSYYGHLNTPMHREQAPYTPCRHSQFSAEQLAQQLRPYEQAQQQQQQMFQQQQQPQGMFPMGTNRSPLNGNNRAVGPMSYEEDPERMMGPRSRAGTTVIPPLNLSNKSPMAATGGSYNSMVQKSITMQQGDASKHRRTLTGEVSDVDTLTFEGMSITPNAFGSFVEINGVQRGASYSPLPLGLGSSAVSSKNSSTNSMVEPLVLSTSNVDENNNEQQAGLVSQAIKLLSPPVTPRDYAVLLGVNFL